VLPASSRIEGLSVDSLKLNRVRLTAREIWVQIAKVAAADLQFIIARVITEHVALLSMSFSRLATVEVQLMMQALDLKSLLTLCH
jgi:hypothetical protein